MNKIIALTIVLGVLTVGQTMAQATPATNVGKQEMTGPGVKKRGTGKIGPEATQNGNMSSTDTQVKFTEGSTSQGTASTPVPGGAKGTNVRTTRKSNTATSTESTSGKTGSQRPTSTAAVEKEARTPIRTWRLVIRSLPALNSLAMPWVPGKKCRRKRYGEKVSGPIPNQQIIRKVNGWSPRRSTTHAHQKIRYVRSVTDFLVTNRPTLP